jgi:hypothetical protein
MKRRGGDIAFALFVAVGLILLGASFFYRVVRTPWGTVLLEKPRPSFGGSYIDTRRWGAEEFMKHWELSKQLMERGLERLPDTQAGGRVRG